MDFVNLVTACALQVEPKLMHALIWKQSGGEPWSFSVPGESLRRVLPTLQDAVREAQATRLEGGRIRVGLTGLSTNPSSVTAVMFGHARTIHLQRGCSPSSSIAAIGRRSLTRHIAQSQPIVAPGIGPTSASRMLSVRQLTRAVRRTSTCRRTLISTRVTLHRPYRRASHILV
jgi:hypothetical protein